MRPVKSRLRILSAKSGKGLIVFAVFNNGETRLIDFKKIFDALEVDKNLSLAKLLTPGVFGKFNMENGTLSWTKVLQDIPWGNGIRNAPFEIGADVLYEFSGPSNEQVEIVRQRFG